MAVPLDDDIPQRPGGHGYRVLRSQALSPEESKRLLDDLAGGS